MQMKGTAEGQPFDMTQTVSGKKVGNCTSTMRQDANGRKRRRLRADVRGGPRRARVADVRAGRRVCVASRRVLVPP